MRALAWLTLIATGACGGQDGPVSVSVVNYFGPPAAGVRVVGHDPAGDLVVERTTDASGRAELDVPDGGSVSVVAAAPFIMTIFAVEPGDELSFRMIPEMVTFYSPTFELPPLPPEATAHEVTAWCVWSGRDPGPRTSVTTDGSCPMPRPVVDTARSDDGRAIAHVVMPDQPELTAELTIPGAWVPPASMIAVNVAGIDLDDAAVGVDRWALLDGYRAHNEYSILRGSAPGRSASMAVPDLGDSAHFTTTASESPPSSCFRHSKTAELVTDVQTDRVQLDLASAPVPDTTVSVSEDGNAIVWEGGSGGTASKVLVDGNVWWYALVPASYNVAVLPRGLIPGDDSLQPRDTLSVSRVSSNRWSSYAASRSMLMMPSWLPEYATPLERGEERHSATTWVRTSVCP